MTTPKRKRVVVKGWAWLTNCGNWRFYAGTKPMLRCDPAATLTITLPAKKGRK